MENNKINIELLIAGFFTNSLSEKEMKMLECWLNEDISHRKEFSELRSSWILSGYETGKKNFNPKLNWLTVDQRIEPGKLWRIKKQFIPLLYAASVLICFTLGAIVTLYMSSKRYLATTTTVWVPLGAKSNIILPDGSSMWLNAGSTAIYSSDFGWKNRDLQLTGEAYFDVKSDSLKPFNVYTQGMIVKAFGTRFNVRAYPDDQTLSATLEEGRIDVVIQSSSGKDVISKTITLKPKEQLVVQREMNDIKYEKFIPVYTVQTNQETASSEPIIKKVFIKPNVKTELSTSWKDNKWIISDEPLALFAENLERKYNLHIQFASEELKEYNFSGTFENETAEQILNALSLAAPINYKFDKNKVILNLNQKDRSKFDKILKNKN